MATRTGPGILVATDEGLHVVKGAKVTRADDLSGRDVRARGRQRGLVGYRRRARAVAEHGRLAVAALPKVKATCLAATRAGLLVGTARAHLMRLHTDQLWPVLSFDEAEGRETWYTPWGAPADVRPSVSEREARPT